MNTEQRIYRLEKMVQYLRCNNNGGGGTSIHNNLQGLQGGQPGQYYHLTQEQYNNLGGIQSIQEGDNISIDNTDPLNPIISATGGGTTGEYIPLTGTEEGKPVTGNIEINSPGYFTVFRGAFDESSYFAKIDLGDVFSCLKAQNEARSPPRKRPTRSRAPTSLISKQVSPRSAMC